VKDLVVPQPAPMPGNAEPTWACVVREVETVALVAPAEERPVWELLAADGRARDAFGAAKYGVRHQRDNGRDHAVDVYQEALDGMMYAHAEWNKSGRADDAHELYVLATAFAFMCRQYLLKRDGR
jgi:hypothetical protein